MDFFKSNLRSGDAVIVRRRQEEARITALQQTVQKNYHLKNIARWEENVQNLVNNKQNQRELQLIEIEKQKALEQRRQKLRNLLAEDEEIYRKEIDDKVETRQQRRERLEARAKKLREIRLKRREEFCQQQKLKQFRNQCDELRLNAGKNLTMECDRVRKQQMAEKELRKEFELKANDEYLKMWSNELQQKIDRETREAKYKKELNESTANFIKQQMYEKEIQKEESKKQKQRDIEERIANLKLAEEEKKQQIMKKRQELTLKREEYRNDYLAYNQRRKREFEEERALDKEFISKAIEREEKENLDKKLKDSNLKSDIKNYLEYLSKLKAEEKEKELLLEKLREQELNESWKKRELKWKKEELARQQLLKNVIQDRQNDIEYKKIVKKKESEKFTDDQQQILNDLNQYNINEKEKFENKLKYNKEIQNFLRKQINEKKEHAIQEKNQIYGTDAVAEQNEAEYKRLLKLEMEKDKELMAKGQTTHHHPRIHANWWTF